jgi:hypothetical protein
MPIVLERKLNVSYLKLLTNLVLESVISHDASRHDSPGPGKYDQERGLKVVKEKKPEWS